MAVGDIDGNGLDDFIIGGAAHKSAQLFLQQPNGSFIQKALLPDSVLKNKTADDMGILLFDADGDPDLYIASGGYQNIDNSSSYQDMLFVNDGRGNFSPDTTALPENFTSKFCVRRLNMIMTGTWIFLFPYVSIRAITRNWYRVLFSETIPKMA